MQPIIKKENILFDVEAKDKDDMIKQMVESFDKQGYLSDKEQFYKDVLAREEVLVMESEFHTERAVERSIQDFA